MCCARFWRVPVSRFDCVLDCEMCGWSVDVSRLRMSECDWLDAETMAELEGGGIEWAIGDRSPEIELVTRSMAAEALEQIAAHLNREAGGALGPE